MNRKFLSVTVCALLVCLSCSQTPQDAKISFVFTQGKVPSKNLTEVRSISPVVISDLESMYSSLGTLVGEYTPTAFEVPLQNVSSYNWTDSTIRADLIGGSGLSKYSVDLAGPVTSSDPISATAGIYNSFLLKLIPDIGESMSGSDRWKNQSRIVVNIPGYSGELSDTSPFAFFDGTYGYDRREIDSNGTFEFSLHQLNKYFPNFELYNLCVSSLNTNAMYIPYDSSGYEISTFCGISMGNTSYPTALVPSANFNFTIGNNDNVTLKLTFDIENCISVYDNNTPLDKSDDIVVLTDGWWNRFSVSY